MHFPEKQEYSDKVEDMVEKRTISSKISLTSLNITKENFYKNESAFL